MKQMTFSHVVLKQERNFAAIKMFSFDQKIASRGYHEYRNSTWINAKAGQKVKVEKETNAKSKSIDPYACAIKIKNRFFDNWITVGHIPREISRHCYFFL